MDRRQFLQQVGLFSTASLLSIGRHSWAARTMTAASHPKRAIVIFLRGAVDGLNVVVPYQETAYYQARPSIAIPPPGKPGGAINLDGRFGLHPSLNSLFPFWQQKSLAFVHACGSPDGTRSHFEAQDYMESGTPGLKRTADGWLNRLLANLPGPNPVQAVNLSLGGWDTHVNQGASRGQLAGRLKALGEGLAALVKGLDSVYQDTVIIVMSEFGRTVRENGNNGTDHGHGNVIWLLGGPIAGGKVCGHWTGLSDDQLYQGRDLPVTTDFRDVIDPVLERHLNLDRTQISQVFPNYFPSQKIEII